MAKRIYAADDNRHIRQVLQMFLTGAGYELCLFEDGDTLYQAFVEKPCDLVILDVMMPGTDGMRICEKLRPVRRAHHHPDGQGQRDKLRRGLLLRRGRLHHQALPAKPSGDEDWGAAEARRAIRPAGRSERPAALWRHQHSDEEKLARCRGVEIPLTLTELKLLQYMLKEGGKALSRDSLLKEVWDFEAMVETRVVDETVRRLRMKLKQVDSRNQIKTVWGYGYKMLEAREA